MIVHFRKDKANVKAAEYCLVLSSRFQMDFDFVSVHGNTQKRHLNLTLGQYSVNICPVINEYVNLYQIQGRSIRYTVAKWENSFFEKNYSKAILKRHS